MTDHEKVVKGLEETKIMLTQAVDRGGEMAAFKCLNRVKDAIAMLKEFPEVIRCKYCKHYEEETGICDLYHAHGYAETWFCADGRRRETND